MSGAVASAPVLTTQMLATLLGLKVQATALQTEAPHASLIDNGLWPHAPADQRR